MFLRWHVGKADQRLAVGLRDRQGQALRTQWARRDDGGGVSAFVFDALPDQAQGLELEVVLLEPLHAEFVVRPGLERLPGP